MIHDKVRPESDVTPKGTKDMSVQSFDRQSYNPLAQLDLESRSCGDAIRGKNEGGGP
jgi:hypothetical protein